MDFTVKRHSIYHELAISDAGASISTGLMGPAECEAIAAQLRVAADDLAPVDDLVPELLDALCRAKGVIESLGCPVDTSITQAIAKATGEQPC